MRADEWYREVLSLWRRLAGPMFPRLSRRIRKVLRDPDATEADYAGRSVRKSTGRS